MIIPTKHTNFSESLLGFGGYILTLLEIPNSIDEFWNKYKNDYANKVLYAKHSFDNLILTIVFLHAIGAVDERDGMIVKCN
jgi:hypothetical protein